MLTPINGQTTGLSPLQHRHHLRIVSPPQQMELKEFRRLGFDPGQGSQQRLVVFCWFQRSHLQQPQRLRSRSSRSLVLGKASRNTGNLSRQRHHPQPRLRMDPFLLPEDAQLSGHELGGGQHQIQLSQASHVSGMALSCSPAPT